MLLYTKATGFVVSSWRNSFNKMLVGPWGAFYAVCPWLAYLEVDESVSKLATISHPTIFLLLRRSTGRWPPSSAWSLVVSSSSCTSRLSSARWASAWCWLRRCPAASAGRWPRCCCRATRASDPPTSSTASSRSWSSRVFHSRLRSKVGRSEQRTAKKEYISSLRNR